MRGDMHSEFFSPMKDLIAAIGSEGAIWTFPRQVRVGEWTWCFHRTWRVQSMRSDGSEPETKTILRYRVARLASREEAAIAELPYRNCRILRWKEGHRGVWYGAFEAADQALAALENQLDFEMTLESSDVDQILIHKRISQCQREYL